MPGSDETRMPAGRHDHRYRSLVLTVLAAQTAPVSAQSLHTALRRRGERLGLSTVYRELHALVQAHEATGAFVGGEAVYRVSERDLLVCDGCGRTEEPTEPLTASGPWEEFFGPRRPVTVHGVCRDCAGTA